MSSNGQTGYELRHLPVVAQQIKDAGEKAAIVGKKTAFVAAMTIVLAKLQAEPTTWGDPEYNLHQPGACVYHGICDPVIAKYAVFERDKVVLVMRITVLARFWD